MKLGGFLNVPIVYFYELNLKGFLLVLAAIQSETHQELLSQIARALLGRRPPIVACHVNDNLSGKLNVGAHDYRNFPQSNDV